MFFTLTLLHQREFLYFDKTKTAYEATRYMGNPVTI